jgi:copper(I)-binding protein
MRSNAFVLAIAFGLAAAATAPAADYTAGSLEIARPWSRATPKGATVGAGYMRISNKGTTPDRLVGGSTDAAAGFEIHEMTMEGGVAKMRPLKGGLEIKPGETVELKPGSYHIMFVDLGKQLAAGDRVKATLTFEKAGAVGVEFDVLAMGAAPRHGMPGMPKH